LTIQRDRSAPRQLGTGVAKLVKLGLRTEQIRGTWGGFLKKKRLTRLREGDDLSGEKKGSRRKTRGLIRRKGRTGLRRRTCESRDARKFKRLNTFSGVRERKMGRMTDSEMREARHAYWSKHIRKRLE